MNIIFIASAGAALLLSLWVGWYGIVILISVGLAAGILGRLLSQSLVIAAENRVLVIYNRELQAFSRLLPTGRHWLHPFSEFVRATISTSTQVLEGSAQAFTDGGLPLIIHWAVTFKFAPLQLAPAQQKAFGKKLAEKGKKIVASQTSHFVQHVMTDITIENLFAPGGRGRVERATRQALAAKAKSMGIEIHNIIIKKIDMPAPVQAALEEAHERAVQTRSEAQALAELQQVVSKFSESDMRRLAELECMRVLGKNGVAMALPLVNSPFTIPTAAPVSSSPSSILKPSVIHRGVIVN